MSNPKRRRHFTGQEKVAILRRHLVEKVPVSDLCEEHGLHPTLFYRWQKDWFEQGAVVFDAPRGRALNGRQEDAGAKTEERATSTVARLCRAPFGIGTKAINPSRRSCESLKIQSPGDGFSDVANPPWTRLHFTLNHYSARSHRRQRSGPPPARGPPVGSGVAPGQMNPVGVGSAFSLVSTTSFPGYGRSNSRDRAGPTPY